ncbi:MAG: DUF5677 domain-containing protein [Armatimonadota bacterium]
MDYIDTLFWETIQDMIRSKRSVANILARKLEKLGISVTDEQIAKIEQDLESSDTGMITLDLDDDALLALDAETLSNMSLALDANDAEEYVNSITEKLVKDLPNICAEMALPLLDELKQGAPEMLCRRKTERTEFEAGLSLRWGKTFDLLEMLLVIAIEAGDSFNEEFRQQKADEKDYVFDVVTRLHARACQVANEALVLMRSGFADGAHARWRTLHEINVISSFIRENGNEVAERYLLHGRAMSYKEAVNYQKYCSRLGRSPFTRAKMERMKKGYDQLINRFGNEYRYDYGWAASVIPGTPSFVDIELATKLDHWRPYYKLACHNVHAGSKGIQLKLGLYPDEEVLLAGPSGRGFTDPVQGIAITLMQITICLLTIEPNIDRLAIMNVLMKLTDEISNSCPDEN